MQARPYGVNLIDDIHTYFPDILYNNSRFTSVPLLMSYINTQMNQHFNTYNRMHMNHAATSTNNVQERRGEPPHRGEPPQPELESQFATNSYMDDQIFLDMFNANRNLFPTTPVPIHRNSTTPPRIGARFHIRTIDEDSNPFIAFMNGLITSESTQVGLTQNQIEENTRTLIHQQADGQCAICFDNYSGHTVRVISRCNHIYHTNCIDRWFQTHSTCPMCRIDLLSNTNTNYISDTDNISDGYDSE